MTSTLISTSCLQSHGLLTTCAMSNAKHHLQQMESNLHTREHLFAESVREVDERHHCANVVLAELLSAADADVCRTMPNTMVLSTSNATYAIKSASGVDVQIAARRCLKPHPCGVSFRSCRGPRLSSFDVVDW